MKRKIAYLSIIILGFASCLLFLYLRQPHIFYEPAVIRHLKTSAVNSTLTFLPSETTEPVSDHQLCLRVLRRTQNFRQGLLEECKRLARNLTVFKTFLEKTAAYVSWHNNLTEAATRSVSTRRSVTWKCLKDVVMCGGYGDQVRGMAYTFFLAILTERVLYIQWPSLHTAKSEHDTSASSPEEAMFVPNAINWSLPSLLSNVPTAQFVDWDAHHEASGVCEALYGPTQHITYSTAHWHPTCFDETFMKNNSTSLALKGFIKLSLDVLEHAITIIAHLLFRYSRGVSERKNELKRELGIGPDTRYVAVHIRAGIFPSGLSETVYAHTATVDAWEKAIECAINRSKALDVTGALILVSDSMPCKQWVSKNYGNRVLTSSVSPIHIAVDTNSWNDQTTMEEKTKRYQSVLATTAELALLSDAAVVAMSQSGFSWVGIGLGGLSTNDIICCYQSCSKQIFYP